MTGYDLESVHLPRLSGPGLRLFTALIESPLTRPLLLGSLTESGGLNKMRALRVDEPPLVYPFPEAGAGEPGAAGPPPDLDALARTDSPPNGFAFTTVRDYAGAYRSGRATPDAVARRALDAIRDSDSGGSPMHIFIAVNADDVMAQARASTGRWREGRPLSLFDGVPVAIKDELDMVPYPTTAGTKFLGRTPAPMDATVVARLRAAGALLLGKANMHEIGINPIGFNAHHGTPRNPYKVSHYTGGSSSGPAAAVAAGLCPVAVGADGGGSIRIPAAFCGVVGLKPSFGRVSEHGAFPLTWTMGHLGPIAATALDAALAYAIMAGPDPADPNSLRQPPVSLEAFGQGDLRGLTFGVYRPWFNHADPQVVAACERALKTVESLGGAIREVEIPELDSQRVAHAITILSEMAQSMERYRASHNHEHAYDVRINLLIGRICTSRDYVQAQRIRARARAHFARVFQQVDALLTPASAITAPPIRPDVLPDGESDLQVVTEIMRYVIPGNLLGLPAMAVPAGYDSAGLPIGLQVVGRYWHEHTLLRVAQALERAVERRRPEVHYNILE